MRLLVAEDDLRLGDLLSRTLKEESYAVDWAKDGQEAEWLAFENHYDMIILDLMMPRKDGLSVLKTLRDSGKTVKVMILTAMDTTDDIVKGLDLGADDYLTKPFSVDEILARVRALLRRQTKHRSAVMKVGPLEIDQARKEVVRGGKKLDLTLKEYSLLHYLAANSGRVVSRTQMAEHVWDMDYEPMSNVVDVYVGYLRNKIDKGFEKSILKTVRGHGYMLDA